MNDNEAAAWLQSMPREKTEAEVREVEQQHDAERGPYAPHEHHAYYEESRH